MRIGTLRRSSSMHSLLVPPSTPAMPDMTFPARCPCLPPAPPWQFDSGVANLAVYLQQLAASGIPTLGGCNVDAAGEPSILGLFNKWEVKEVAGVKVGRGEQRGPTRTGYHKPARPRAFLVKGA